MNKSSSPVKELVVPPLAAGRETLGLLVALCVILLLAGLRVIAVAPKQSNHELQAYQLLDIKLKNQAPVLYRALLSAVDSITWLRESEGQWPNVATLQQESLPPFADRFLPTGLRGFFRWEEEQGATWVDYYGSSKNAVAAAEKAGADPLESSFILRIIDRQAGSYPYPVAPQEKGQENRFSAQIWINTNNAAYSQGPLDQRGWKWILSSSAIAEE
jgi:hypothetical protein